MHTYTDIHTYSGIYAGIVGAGAMRALSGGRYLSVEGALVSQLYLTPNAAVAVGSRNAIILNAQPTTQKVIVQI